jgi:hypothetical protein
MSRGKYARRDDETLARRAEVSLRALNRLRWRLFGRRPGRRHKRRER